MTIPASKRFNWIFFLSGLALQVCITVANSQHPLSAHFLDNRATRNLTMAHMDPVTEQVDDIEARGGVTDVARMVPKSVREVSPTQLHVTSLYDSIMAKNIIKTRTLASDQYAAWEKAVTAFFKGDREQALMAISTTLLYKWGVESFQKVLDDAKANPLTEAIANSIQEARLQYWRKGGENAHTTFKWLLINGKEPDILKNPSLKIWLNYVIGMYPNVNEYALLILNVKGVYSMGKYGDFLVRLFNDNRSTNRRASVTAKNAIVKQLDTWSGSRKSENDVYILLELDKDAAPLSNHAIYMWAWYVGSELHINPSTLLFPRLQNVYTDEADLAYAIISFEETNRVSISGSLLDHLLEHWLADGKSTMDVTKLLKRVQAKYKVDQSKVSNAIVWYAKYSFARGYLSHQGRLST